MKNKAWIRFLNAYLSFILCSLLIMVPTYLRYYSILQKQECDISSAMLSNGMNQVERQILSLISLSQTTYADSRYKQLFVQETEIPVSALVPLIQIQNNFSSLIGTQPLISDAGIFLRNGVFFTRYRNFFNNTSLQLYNKFFTYGDLDAEQWNDLLYANAGGGFLPSVPIKSADYYSYEGITYICAWPSNSPNHFPGILYATIKTEDILSLLVSEDVLEDGYVQLYDSRGKLLINYQHNQSNKKYQTISFEGANLRVEVGIADSLIAARLAPIRNILMIYLLGMTLFSVILASFFAYRNTNPIRKLVGIVSRTPNAPRRHPGNLNEYDFIANAVTSLDHTVDTFAQTIELQKDIIRIHVFEKALTDGLHSRSVQSEFAKAFSDFPPYYQLASLNFQIQEDNALEVLVSMYGEISGLLSDKVYAQTYGDSALVLLLPVCADTSEDFWETPLKSLHGFLTEKYDLDFRIALSERFEDSKRLPEAYSQLRSIELLSDGQSSASIWQLRDFPKHSPYLALDFSSMQLLYDVLHLGDMEAAQSILDANLQSIQANGYTDEVVIKQVFYNFRNILMRVKLENQDSMDSVSIPVYEQSSHVRKLFISLSRCCEEICTHIRKLRESSKTRFSDSVCAFILENFSNKDLYAKMVAGHFGISETTLQKIVQSATGKTFFEYIEGLRLEKAYHLLKTTSFTVSRVADDCGFSTQNSFYKAFKRHYHQPPGALRK